MNGNLINWLVGIVGTLTSLMIAGFIWVLKEHWRSDEKQFELVRQRLHDAMNDIEGLKAILKLRKNERERK